MKLTLTRSLGALALGIASFSAHTTPQSIDIVVIRLGATLEESKEMIKAHNSSLVPIEVPARGGGIFGIVAQISNPPEPFIPPHGLFREDFFISPTAAG